MTDRDEQIERLLKLVRENLDTTTEGRGRFEGVRAELVFKRVLARMNDERPGGLPGDTWLMRTVRAVTAMGATLWNSRAMRMLVP